MNKGCRCTLSISLFLTPFTSLEYFFRLTSTLIVYPSFITLSSYHFLTLSFALAPAPTTASQTASVGRSVISCEPDRSPAPTATMPRPRLQRCNYVHGAHARAHDCDHARNHICTALCLRLAPRYENINGTTKH